MGAALRLAGTKPPASAIRRGLASGVDSEVADRLVVEFARESTAYFTDNTPQHAQPARRGYLATTADREIGSGLQARHERVLGPNWQASMATGHLPMLERPHELAAHIASFVSAVDERNRCRGRSRDGRRD